MGFVTSHHLSLLEQPGPRETAVHAVSADMVRRFVQAVMDNNPLYQETDEAAASRFGGPVTPPLFPLHAPRREPGAPDPLDRLADEPDWDGASGGFLSGLPPLDLPLDRILNGGTEAEFFRLARVGDVISNESRYVRIEDKEGRSGPMVVLTVQTDYRNQDDELLVSVRRTLIRR